MSSRTLFPVFRVIRKMQINTMLSPVGHPVTSLSLMLKSVIVTLVFLLGGVSLRAYAQPSDPATQAARQHEQRLLQEQQRQQDQLQTRQPAVDIFLQPEFDVENDEEALAGGRCFDIHTIHIEGVTRYSRSEQKRLTAPFTDQCLDLNAINLLLKNITNLYISDGFVTSRAFLQPQSLREGELTLLVVEGRLERLKSVDTSLSVRQLYSAFPVSDGTLVNLRDLEQGLEQLNRLQQNRAEMDIEPGNQQGDSVIAVRNQSAGRVHGSVGVNNSGSQSTGEWMLSTWLSVDNPTASNDNIYLSYSEALDSPERSKSRSYAAAYTVPRGYALFGYNANYFEYQQLVKGSAVNFVTSGTSFNQTLNADYTLLRRQQDKLAITTSLTRKESKNYLEDVFLETSSRVLYLVDLGAIYTRPLARGTFRGVFKWYRSVDWFDATTKLVNAESDFQFDKYSLDLSVNTAVEPFGIPLFYTSSIHFFYSPEDIIASEALSIGGRYTVRGVEGESLFGYRGGYWRNELTHTTYFENSGRLDWFWGIDVGASDTPYQESKNSDWVSGAATGIRYINGNFSMDAAWSQAIHTPAYLSGDKHGVYAAAQLNF